MNRRAAPRLRPMLDRLEGRIVLSSLPIAPAAAIGPAMVAQGPRASEPVLTANTYARVMKQIDWAFDDYKGRHSGLTSLANDAAYLVSAAVLPSPTPNTSQNGSSSDVLTDGQGDGVALEDGLRKAVDHLPFGQARVAPLIVRAWGDGGMTPENSSLYRDRFKTMVRQYVAQGLQDRQFAWSGPHRPALAAGRTTH